MTGPTHVTFAGFIYLLLLTPAGVSLDPVNAAVIAVSALLPDIDTAASRIGKMVPGISLRIERRFGHRTITHSAFCIAVLGLIAYPISHLSRDLYACFLTGYASHPFLDTMTVNGVKLFHPFSPVKCVFPLEVNNPHRYRIRTGGRMDKALGIIFLLGCIPTFIVAYQGYERFIRAAQQTIEAGVRDFEEMSRDHLVFGSVSALNMLTKQPLKGTFRIVGALNSHTLLFRGSDGLLHTLGKDFQADFVTRSIICERGSAARSSVHSIDLSNRLLAEITYSLDTTSENYFFGDLSIDQKVSLPENIRMFTPVSGGGGSVKFNYGTCDDLRRYALEDVFVLKGVLTVKSIVTRHTGNSDTSNPRTPGEYAQFTSLMELKDSVEFLKGKGDSLRENEVIARKDGSRFFHEQAILLGQKLSALKDRSEAAASGLERRIEEAKQKVQIDSTECTHSEEMLRNGFISEDVFNTMQLKWRKNKRALSEVIAWKVEAGAKAALEIQALDLSIKEHEAKAASAARQAEIRSPANGILLDIRRFPRSEKTALVFIIKRYH